MLSCSVYDAYSQERHHITYNSCSQSVGEGKTSRGYPQCMYEQFSFSDNCHNCISSHHQLPTGELIYTNVVDETLARNLNDTWSISTQETDESIQFEATDIQRSVLPPGDLSPCHGLTYKRSRRRRRHVTASQRQAANRRERRRMSQLNDAFNELRDRVPVPDYERKPSRIDTLKLATDYIQFMTRLLMSRDTSSLAMAKPCCSKIVK